MEFIRVDDKKNYVEITKLTKNLKLIRKIMDLDYIQSKIKLTKLIKKIENKGKYPK